MDRIAFIVAAVLLGLAIQLHDGEYTPGALILVTLALLLLIAGLVTTSTNEAVFRRVAGPPKYLQVDVTRTPVLMTFGVSFAIQFAILFVSWPGVDLPHRGRLQLLPFHLGLAAAALFAFSGLRAGMIAPKDASSLLHSRWRFAGWFPGVLAVSLLLSFWMVHSSPAPRIDVWQIQQGAAAELLRGHNPYAMTFPDMYHSTLAGHSPVYGNGLVVNDRLQFGFVYPPLSLLLSTIGYALTGEHRYAQAVALVLAAAFIGYARPGPVPKLAATLLLFTPQVFFIIGRAWTEPFLILFLAATVFVACRCYRCPSRMAWSGHPVASSVWLGVTLGLFLATKQYAVLALPISFLLLPRGWRWRDCFLLLWAALLVFAGVTLPFALANPPAFWKSTMTALVSPFRWDALTYLAWYGLRGHSVTEPSVALLCSTSAVVLAYLLSLWRAPRNPAGFAAALSLAVLVFFAFNKQAFANYYFFVIGALCCSIAASGPPAENAATSPIDSPGQNSVVC